MDWHIIKTKPRHELKVAARLEKLGMEVYCPLKIEVRQWSDRKKKIKTPLFTKYVFVKLIPKDRNMVFYAPGVLGYLFYLGNHALVKEKEIDTIKNWCKKRNSSSLRIENFTLGDKVLISSGAFKDKKAIIKHMEKDRLRLVIPSIGFTICTTTNTALQKVC